MTTPGATNGDAAESIDGLLRAAEPGRPKPLSELVDRLRSLGQPVTVIPPDPMAPDSHTAGIGRSPDPGDAGSAPFVRGVTADSRSLVPGALFIAIPGARADGHQFAADAERAGASALVVDHPVAGRSIPQVVVERTRPILAEAAAWWYGDPSHELGVIGITGTDGKTTTSFLAAAGLSGAGVRTGLLGTVATQIGGRREANPAHSTTPESPILQRALRAMVQAGDQAVVIETTSHGLAMDRVRAIDYDLAVVTNLTHEHLEMHGTFEAYRSAKRLLFENLAGRRDSATFGKAGWPRTGIVNLDDPSAPTFVEATLAAGARLVTYGASPGADLRLQGATEDQGGLRVDYLHDGQQRSVRLHLAGRFNAYNALAAAALGWALDLDMAAFEAGLGALGGVPGRMERIDRGQPFTVIVDYAHSPASLRLVLDELGPIAAGRGGGLITVFGSAGERDRDKRPMMGQVAAERSRIVVLTDEDPRGEARSTILAELAAGANAATHRPEAILQIPDRSAAVREALRRARPGDVVLLAGKGHETTIEYADHAQPWDERREAEAALGDLGWGS